MENTSSYSILFKMVNNGIVGSINKVKQSITGVQSAVKKVNDSLKALNFNAMLDQVDRVANGLNAMAGPGLKLSTSMADLSSITGVTGSKLKEIEGYARANAKTFGGSAADGVEAYKLVLSQLNPEIAKTPAALKEMGNTISTLSKTMGGDTVAATDTLTTAMNQYQVSTDDPIRASKIMAEMMNIMAAAAKEGSAELPQIKQALEQSGMAAKMAGVSFAETNAAIQVLDKAGKKGSEGGVALRNVMATLSQGRFLPKDVKQELAGAGVNINKLTDKSIPLADRLKQLRGIMNDSALVTKLFGKENSNAALALISGIAEQERLTGAITGTNTAYEQAAIIMESPEEKNKRLQASVDDFKISLFNASNGLLGYASVIGSTASDLANIAPLISGMGKAFLFLTNAQKMSALWTSICTAATSAWTGVQWLLNAAFWANPLTWVIAAIVALIAVIAYVISKTTGWGEAWKHTVNGAKLLWQTFVAAGKLHFDTMVAGIMIGLNLIKRGWYVFKNAIGLGNKNENNAAIAQIDADTKARAQSIINGTKKVASLAKQSMAEFGAAGASLKWKKSTDKKDEKKSSGIADPTNLLGAASAGNAGNGGGAGGGGKATTDAIATGGSKNTQISINFKDLIGILQITPGTFKEGVSDMEQQVTDALIRVLGSAQATAG